MDASETYMDVYAIPVGAICFALLLAAQANDVGSPRTQAVDLGSRRHLFIDGSLVGSAQGVRLVVNPPRFAGVALEPGPQGSFDDAVVGAFGQVLEDGGVYRLYYRGAWVRDPNRNTQGPHSRLGYAESTDGVHWTKPALGIVAHNGSRDNNITCPDIGYVMIDPKAPAEARHKLLCAAYVQIGAKDLMESLDPDRGGLYFYTSPDGLHWTWQPQRVLPRYPDTLNQVDYDPSIGRYVAYVRTWPKGFFRGPQYTYGRAIGRVDLDDPLKPWPLAPVEKPFQCWGPDRIANVSTEVPTVLEYPGYSDDGRWTDIYNPSLVKYPWAPGVYLSFTSRNIYQPDSKIQNYSTLDIGMAVSRDGIHWTWPSTGPYVPLGPAGSGQSGMLFMLVGMIRHGDEIYQYYYGTDAAHGQTHGPTLNSGRIYRVAQRLDGFVSVDFDDDGTFTTPPLRFVGNRLRLNANAAGGELRVGILDEAGQPIPGLGPADCRPIRDDATNLVVGWPTGRLDELQGKPVRLLFQGRQCKLFAMQFE